MEIFKNHVYATEGSEKRQREKNGKDFQIDGIDLPGQSRRELSALVVGTAEFNHGGVPGEQNFMNEA